MENNLNLADELLVFSNKKQVPLILQTEIAECGLASMAMIASFYGHQFDMASMRQFSSAQSKGMNLQQLIKLGDKLALASRPLRCDISDLAKLTFPCILHWDLNHFVVLTGIKKKQFFINDPSRGKRVLNTQDFSQHFTGVVLELTPTHHFEKRDEQKKLKLHQLWSKIFGLKTALTKVFVLSIIIQIFSLLSPYYMQLVVDEVLVSYDESLLIILVLGFSFITVINVITESVRSWLILRLSSLLNMQMGVNLLRHLFRLPMNYFESRHIGDIVSRFGSLAQLRERMTTGIVETAVDGLMSITVLIVMFMYSIPLTALVLSVIIIYMLIRLSLYKPINLATENTIHNQAKEQSNFLESIRGIQTIKLFSHETQRQSLWQNKYADVINSEIHLSKLNISIEAINKLLFGIENILLIYFSAHLVMEGVLTVGILLAFIAYKNQLITRFNNLIDQTIQFKMMRLHLNRIADIALHQQEEFREGDGSHLLSSENTEAELRLENISFSYSNSEANIINELSYTFKPGDSIAITGASGSGKTTLIKIMLGLLKPCTGRIFYNKVDITHLGLSNYRKNIAAIMQDDTLLTGSISDNISFFSPERDDNKIIQCAKLASIDKEIMKMPMTYNTPIGDMGSNLSGGQIQRILLARALYQQPSILLMDEATSHLDSHNEEKITKEIQQLDITRITIAHRPETIARAKKVVELKDGYLKNIEKSTA